MKTVGRLLREQMVDTIKKGVEESSSVFLVRYSNLSGIKLTDFRKGLSEKGASVCSSKNSITKLALKELEQPELADSVSEKQTALIWTDEDSAAVSKFLKDFAKENEENVSIAGGIVEGRYITDQDVQKLADLPSREVLLAMLLGTIQAPLTRFAGALNAKTRDLLYILKQLSEQKSE